MILIWCTKLSVGSQSLCVTAKDGCVDAHAKVSIATALPRHTNRFLLQLSCMIKHMYSEQPPAVTPPTHHLGVPVHWQRTLLGPTAAALILATTSSPGLNAQMDSKQLWEEGP